ncbi:MAG: MFS transporter [Gammaproteobacteria bacterium]|nr:MFS transporter [Gammaproteobacteria bacterium]
MSAEQPCRPSSSCLTFSKIQPWLVCLSAALFFFYEFIQMSLFNSISNELMQDFHINATQLGNLSATYFYADVLFLLPAGIILDRLRVKTVILISMLVCIAGTLLFAISNSALIAGICHFMTGIGNAFCFLSCIMLASRWFPPQRMAIAIGSMITLGMLGGVVAQTPFIHLVALIGWRHAVMINAGMGMAIFILILCVVKDFPPHHDHAAAKKKKLHHDTASSPFLLATRNPQNWLAGLYTCLLNLPIFLLGQLWGNMYLTQVHHLTHTQAASVAMMIFFGTMIGSPLIGWISDALQRRRLPMLVCAILSLGLILLIMFTQPGFIALFFLFLLLGILTSAQVISYPLITESNPPHITGTATGLASVLIMGGGAVFQPLFGWFMDLHWNHTVIQDIPMYTPSNYLLAMSILPVAFLLGLITTLFLKETHCRSV